MSEVTAILAAYGAAFMATLLAASAIHKLTDWSRLARSAAILTGLGGGWGAATLIGASIVELTAAIGLISPATRALAALLAAGLWGLYLVLIARALAAGRSDIDCGCAFGQGRSPLGRFEIGRNLTLTSAAVLVAVGARAAPGAAIGLGEMLGGAALFSLYVAADQIALLTPNRGWR